MTAAAVTVVPGTFGRVSLFEQQSAGVFEVQEKMEGVCWGLHELTEVLVEASILFVACVYQQCPAANIVGHPHGPPYGVDQESSAEAPVPFALVNRKSSQQQTRDLRRNTTLAELGG